ncbi:hypothetical protein IMG5_037570 [Ichthyophthirius multifiliis]|uniref:Uncharacterized protein n=1 Tax=Ichthyophthirius multifiliis TaxID=5932 RepID=G0QLW0_ICHMU|nr:hypothetical protein IMG5_037570 [Ichthyophthirius multifiliis]EGR33794.1 hypothetical protein IMG5_037570 [Ichthyophthirius multifiliis]|eukprot:XP_004039018.1 hypothetical protein IMG5_037570 [Ichthyophthirius multifiliis]
MAATCVYIVDLKRRNFCHFQCLFICMSCFRHSPNYSHIWVTPSINLAAFCKYQGVLRATKDFFQRLILEFFLTSECWGTSWRGQVCFFHISICTPLVYGASKGVGGNRVTVSGRYQVYFLWKKYQFWFLSLSTSSLVSSGRPNAPSSFQPEEQTFPSEESIIICKEPQHILIIFMFGRKEFKYGRRVSERSSGSQNQSISVDPQLQIFEIRVSAFQDSWIFAVYRVYSVFKVYYYQEELLSLFYILWISFY